MNPVRFGIVGIGGIGGTHVRCFLEGQIPGAQLTAVADINPAALEKYPDIPGYTGSSELIRSGLIDAVIIATPHYAHIPIGIEALEHGLHVMCEKPLGVHVADCRQLLAAHKKPKQIFGVMFDTRTVPRYQKLREMVLGGELGRIRRINWILTTWFRSQAYYDSSPWRATWDGEGGGMLVNQLPHDLDLFQWIFGLPKRVRAHCPIGKYHDIEVEDEVNAMLEFEDGATGIFVATTGEFPGSDRREVIGDKGRVIIYPDYLEFTRTEIPMDQYCSATSERFNGPKFDTIKIPTPGEPGRHSEVLRRFVAAIQEGKPLIAEAKEAVASVELANAIILSSLLDRTVELPLDPGFFEKILNERRATSRFDPTQALPAVSSSDMAASFTR